MNFRIAKVVSIAMLMGALTSNAQAAAPVYRFVDLGSMDGVINMTATGINNLGQVIGYGSTESGEKRAFSWRAGQGLTNLGAPQGAVSVYTGGINDAGTAVMNALFVNSVTGVSSLDGYTWNQDSGFAILNSAGAGSAWGINKAGQIAGIATIGDHEQAAIWSNGSYSLLPGLGSDDIRSAAYQLNDKGEVIGYVRNSTGNHAVIWRNGQISEVVELPGAEETGLVDISSSGRIVGFSSMWYMNYEPIQIMPGANQVESMGMGGQIYEATGINNAGVIIGYRAMSFDYDNTFYWSQETGGVSMTSLIDPATLPAGGMELQQLFDINDKGQIVGNAIFGGQYRAVLLDPVPQPVPEPTALSFLICGLLVLGMAYKNLNQRNSLRVA